MWDSWESSSAASSDRGPLDSREAHPALRKHVHVPQRWRKHAERRVRRIVCRARAAQGYCVSETTPTKELAHLPGSAFRACTKPPPSPSGELTVRSKQVRTKCALHQTHPRLSRYFTGPRKQINRAIRFSPRSGNKAHRVVLAECFALLTTREVRGARRRARGSRLIRWPTAWRRCRAVDCCADSAIRSSERQQGRVAGCAEAEWPLLSKTASL